VTGAQLSLFGPPPVPSCTPPTPAGKHRDQSHSRLDDVPSHSLGALVAWAGADGSGAHRAAADVEALVVVLREILRRSGRSLEELHGEPSRL